MMGAAIIITLIFALPGEHAVPKEDHHGTTWIGRGGYFHSEKMHVVEKFRREGDAIFYDVTLEDPEVLVEPLVFPTRIMRRNTAANAGVIRERGKCERNFEAEAAESQM